jgi:DNA-binding Xre family transcriptional regulator
VKWNLRWAAARQDIWRPSDLLLALRAVGFNPSLSKVAALWSGTPITVRLDDLDRICAALHCTVADLIEAEPLADQDTAPNRDVAAAGDDPAGHGPAAPTPRRRGGRGRPVPPN